MRKFGVIHGAAPSEKSGKFVVRIPKTVHQKLDIEARHEGVSLNQLAACKLSIPLWNSEGLTYEVVVDAFNATHDGYSTDWVIVEPGRNARFLEKCKSLGLRHGAWVLNHALMNIRKTTRYSARLNRATKRAGFSDYDEYAFASEIAVRTLQRTEGVTLDRMLCDPTMRERFDELARQLAPTQPVIKLRCAALNLRKTHRLRPMPRNTTEYDLVAAGPLRRVDLSMIATLPGTYVFYDVNRPIYAGETENLHKRIEMHLKSGLPRWLQADMEESLVLKTLVLPSAKRDDRLDWLGAFVNRERPLLNYQKAA
ncbi:MAG TPA: toxin-antitoxin system HicB family antitoxin [Pirellulales bacterium]|nr:toxin-antitoxin system HicB family antitoxin [Pirellulales bacterium]